MQKDGVAACLATMTNNRIFSAAAAGANRLTDKATQQPLQVEHLLRVAWCWTGHLADMNTGGISWFMKDNTLTEMRRKSEKATGEGRLYRWACAPVMRLSWSNVLGRSLPALLWWRGSRADWPIYFLYQACSGLCGGWCQRLKPISIIT